MTSYNKKIENYLLEQGASEVGFSKISTELQDRLLPEYQLSLPLDYALSVVVKLSDSVVETITDRPTHAYFHHYRTVNTLLDQLILKAGLMIEQQGFRYLPIAASQSINGYQGLFQHKTAARLSGLGNIGNNALFISNRFGPRVRLATLLTDMPFEVQVQAGGGCINCGKCAALCPALAISGQTFDPAQPERELVDRQACSDYMKKQFQKIGRGSVCGICMRNCPMENTSQS